MEELKRKWGGGEVLARAVSGMLPKNRLRKVRLGRLKGRLRFFLCVFLSWGVGGEGWESVEVLAAGMAFDLGGSCADECLGDSIRGCGTSV